MRVPDVRRREVDGEIAEYVRLIARRSRFVAFVAIAAAFVNTWIELKRKDGTLDALYKYWILGLDATPREPRWSIMRNVLGWTR